jgi:hypothetical protein
MSSNCQLCNATIDPVHDKHYYCDRCMDPKILYCPDCTPNSERCPRCGGDLEYHRESITKRMFQKRVIRG